MFICIKRGDNCRYFLYIDNFEQCEELASLHGLHCPPGNGIRAATLCVLGPVLLSANGDSLLAYMSRVGTFGTGGSESMRERCKLPKVTLDWIILFMRF